ncbi:uncharacterized protein LOC127712952 [Mytilus californianus]|uniref:uncharacterized protein LOC127712952 n=1 Tax=Mytilus californianus TaxID=6549 RepID=UPI002248637D|nr:uncharacterized protein LOC127712952 [Mytilus californianus]
MVKALTLQIDRKLFQRNNFLEELLIMSSLDDWSPPVSPSIIAAMEVDVIPETCSSQTEDYYAPGNRSNTASPSKLSDIGDVFGQEQNLDDFPITSTQFDNLNDGQV